MASEKNVGLVPVSAVRPWVERLVERSGSQRRAADAAGVSAQTISNLLDGRRKDQLVQRRVAARVFAALRRY